METNRAITFWVTFRPGKPGIDYAGVSYIEVCLLANDASDAISRASKTIGHPPEEWYPVRVTDVNPRAAL